MYVMNISVLPQIAHFVWEVPEGDFTAIVISLYSY